MSDFRPDLHEITFNLRNVADLDGLCELDTFAHAEPDMVDGVLSEAARFAAEVIAPLNRTGDIEGSRHTDSADGYGSVTTPKGFREAYSAYVQAGWGAVSLPPEHGGGGFPHLVGLAIEEMFASACMSWSLCPLLTQGAINMLGAHGSPELQAEFLPRMVTGEWTGTMNLTEPHAGSDVGALSARAVPQGDGTYRLHGTKIFITYGEHDLTDNVVHLVLARVPDAPPGTRGISSFLVPKYLPGPGGALGARNDVRCVSIEHKLGIHASPTCVMAYGDDDGAVGYLIGDENAGMANMFTMMNYARLSVGLEGVAISERAYQQALAYAHERRQGRALGAPKGESSPIVAHPDVARMLLDMRSTTSAMRGLAYRNAEAIDRSLHEPSAADRQAASERAALLTPLTKAWATDTGCELTSVGVQVHGGMGFVEETGAAQHYRDARIAPIYEGTNGIQAADLVGRKLAMRGGAVVKEHLDDIRSTIGAAGALGGPGGNGSGAGLGDACKHLAAAVDATEEAASWLLGASPGAALAGSAPFLKMLAVTTAGAALVDGALAARDPGRGHSADLAADRAVLARFFASSRVAGVAGLLPAVTEPADDLAAASERLLSL